MNGDANVREAKGCTTQSATVVVAAAAAATVTVQTMTPVVVGEISCDGYLEHVSMRGVLRYVMRSLRCHFVRIQRIHHKIPRTERLAKLKNEKKKMENSETREKSNKILDFRYFICIARLSEHRMLCHQTPNTGENPHTQPGLATSHLPKAESRYKISHFFSRKAQFFFFYSLCARSRCWSDERA